MEAQDTKKELTPIQQKREALKQMSGLIKPLIKEGIFDSINEALIDAYTTSEHHEFKTFNQWKKDGFFVKKGAKAFLVWGKPKGNQEETKESAETAEDEGKFYPICFLFSNAQVEQKGGAKNV